MDVISLSVFTSSLATIDCLDNHTVLVLCVSTSVLSLLGDETVLVDWI